MPLTRKRARTYKQNREAHRPTTPKLTPWKPRHKVLGLSDKLMLTACLTTLFYLILEIKLALS